MATQSRRLLSACTALAATACVTGAGAPSAHACSGDYCSGLDPIATGCARDAYTVAHVQLPAVAQRLDLRWSPRCKTNWARMTLDHNPSWLRAVQLPGGYTQWLGGRGGGNSWSRMIYSPVKCVYAEVQTQSWGRWRTACV